MDSDIAMGCLEFPLGLAPPPAIFASRTDAIQTVRHRHRAVNGSWSGRGGFRSFLLMGDAILFESGVGTIFGETVTDWGATRRGLLWNDSLNDQKTPLQGSWSGKGLVPGIEIETETEIILAPRPTIDGARLFILWGGIRGF